MSNKHAQKRECLPEFLRDLFWDYDFDDLNWQDDRDLITLRVLASGTWDAVKWLRDMLDDRSLREWIISRQGRGLSPAQLRFWELKLRLSHKTVSVWIKLQCSGPWGGRNSS
ncbi:MAG: hypothetical protein PHT33_13065 [bacterium]|nr:hypothetical protein [bacterium]